MLSSHRLCPRSWSLAVAFIDFTWKGSDRRRGHRERGLLAVRMRVARNAPRRSAFRLRLLAVSSAGQVTRVVPELVHRFGHVVLVAERAQARGAEQEVASAGRGQPQPARAEHAQDVTAREQEHVTARRAHARDHPVGARAGVRRRLAVRAAVAKELPTGPSLQDLGRSLALVVAVVPFDEVGLVDRRPRRSLPARTCASPVAGGSSAPAKSACRAGARRASGRWPRRARSAAGR